MTNTVQASLRMAQKPSSSAKRQVATGSRHIAQVYDRPEGVVNTNHRTWGNLTALTGSSTEQPVHVHYRFGK